MGAERALAPLQALHDVGDRDHRGVAGEDGVGADVRLDLGEQLLLERQILKHRLDHIVGVAHGGGEIGDRRHAVDRAFVVAEVLEIGEDAMLRRRQRLLEGIVDRHIVAGEREHLRDAVAHQAGADDGDALVSPLL